MSKKYLNIKNHQNRIIKSQLPNGEEHFFGGQKI